MVVATCRPDHLKRGQWMFEALGLSQHTEAVYLAMLQMPEASLEQLARHVGIDEGQMRQALDDLARMSLVQGSAEADNPRAVDPQVGLSVLLARQQADVARRQQEVEESKAAF